MEQCVSSEKKDRIQPLFQCHPKDPLRQRSSVVVALRFSAYNMVYTLHDSLCSSAVNMGNLTSILQVHRSEKEVQYIKWTWPTKKKVEFFTALCAYKCCFSFSVSNRSRSGNFKVLLYNVMIGVLLDMFNVQIAKCKLGICYVSTITTYYIVGTYTYTFYSSATLC